MPFVDFGLYPNCLILILGFMLTTKKFLHPCHMANYFSAIAKKALAQVGPRKPISRPVPDLEESQSYYFSYSSSCRPDLNEVHFSLVCFSWDGAIVFSHIGRFDVSLHAFRRLGFVRQHARITGTIRNIFRRYNVPLIQNSPFHRVQDGLFWCNINWSLYRSLLNS